MKITPVFDVQSNGNQGQALFEKIKKGSQGQAPFKSGFIVKINLRRLNKWNIKSRVTKGNQGQALFETNNQGQALFEKIKAYPKNNY